MLWMASTLCFSLVPFLWQAHGYESWVGQHVEPEVELENMCYRSFNVGPSKTLCAIDHLGYQPFVGQCPREDLARILEQLRESVGVDITKVVRECATESYGNIRAAAKAYKDTYQQMLGVGRNPFPKPVLEGSHAFKGFRQLHPSGVYIVEEFVSPAERAAILRHRGRFVRGPDWDQGHANGVPFDPGTLQHSSGGGYETEWCCLSGKKRLWRADFTQIMNGATPGLAAMRTVSHKIQQLTGIRLDSGRYNDAQIVRNRLGGFISDHYDIDTGGRTDTLFSVLAYLQEPDKGGQVTFPELGLRVQPKSGSALIFSTKFLHGELDPTMRHAAESVLGGEKWLYQQFIQRQPDVTASEPDLVRASFLQSQKKLVDKLTLEEQGRLGSAFLRRPSLSKNVTVPT